ERMVTSTMDTYGRIDILFNNAGIVRGGALTVDTTEEDWDLLINTNLKSVFLCLKHTIPVMLSQGEGVIINTASGAGLIASPSQIAYGVSKAGVIYLTKTTALEYARQNIRINCICPGPVDTPIFSPFLAIDPSYREPLKEFTPLGRMGQPGEIAQTALYLACDDSSYVTGAAIPVDGGGTAGFIVPSPIAD
ncbi:SDR family NAD(P)-dependent oxidoreductase, partial [Chloroflexota bacterium]